MKIYTRTGDRGQTGIIGGNRVDKDDVRIEAYGTVDELNSFVGQAGSLMESGSFADFKLVLLQIQDELFDSGTDLARESKDPLLMRVSEPMIEQLEKWIDTFDAECPDITRFILPGGSLISSALHVCRTVCRRAERRVISLAKLHEVNGAVPRYLNRLSDLFFTMARAANIRTGKADVEYARSAEVFRSE